MRNVLHLPSSGQMQRSHNADCASAQLFYPTPSQPWINATKYGEWPVQQLPPRSPMVVPWDAGRSHQEHPNSWTQQEAFWCHFTIRLSVGRAQHACILDMKNTPFGFMVILIRLSTEAQACCICKLGSSCLPVSHTHSIFDPLKEKKDLGELVENFTYSSTRKRDKKKVLVNTIMA